MSAPMNTGALIRTSVKLLEEYNPSRATVEVHCAEFFDKQKIANDRDRLFLHQVLYGCVRYKKTIKTVLQAFYFRCSGAGADRKDMTLYTIMIYLTVFRVEDMGIPAFQRILLSQQDLKMHVFLSFLLDLDSINRWLRDEWLKIYDMDYVDGVLIGGLMSLKEQIGPLLAILEERATGKKSESRNTNLEATGLSSNVDASATKRHATVPEPFNLTKPQPRTVPPPEVIPMGQTAVPVPDSNQPGFVPPIHVKLEEARKVAREQTTKPQPFNLRVHQRPSNFEKIKTQVLADEEAKLQFDGPKAKPVPRFEENAAQVRLNAAHILREDALLVKKQEQEANLIKAYEEGLRDSAEFDAWQQKMRTMDEVKRLEEVKRRQLEMQLAAEAAIEAKQKRVEENQRLVVELREEAKAGLDKRKEEAMVELGAKQDQVAGIIEERELPRQAKKDILAKNKKKAEAIAVESQELAARAAKEREEEQRRKDDYIRQIRALERVLKERVKVFDPTETAGYGLLEEMSLTELKERLAVVKRREAEIVEAKREEIRAEKAEKERILHAKAERILRRRQIAAVEAAERREKKLTKAEEEARAHKEKLEASCLDLQVKLQQKREDRAEERRRLKAEEKSIRIQNQFLAADKDKVEEKKYDELRLGAEREANVRQNAALEDQAVYSKIRHLEAQIRQKNVRTAQKERNARLKAYDNKVLALKEENQQLLDDVTTYNQSRVIAQKQREKLLQQQQGQRRVYSDTLREKNLKLSTRKSEAVSGVRPDQETANAEHAPKPSILLATANPADGTVPGRKASVTINQPLTDAEIQNRLAPAQY
eukprot:Rmarinus@m.13881